MTKKSLTEEGLAFESYMLPQDQIESGIPGGFRLLEVDNRVVLPVHTSARLLITSSDVIHS